MSFDSRKRPPSGPRFAPDRDQWVRASELGEFAFCRRAWWLRRVRGRRPDAAGRARLALGRHAHGEHARAVLAGGRAHRSGRGWLAVAFVLLLLAMWAA